MVTTLRRYSLPLAIAVALFSRTQSTLGDDWPQWRGPNRDNASAETGLLEEWPANGPPLEWRADGLGQGIASVSVAGGRIYTVGYVEGGEYLFALSQASGELVWATRIGSAVKENRVMRWLSQRCPTVDKGRVYVMRADGDLVCLQVADGVELWRKSYPKVFGSGRPPWGYCDHPLVDGERLICAPGGEEAAVVALNKFSGEVIWATKVPDVDRPGYCSLIAAQIGGVRQYVAVFPHRTIGVAAQDGRTLWHDGKLKPHYGACHTPQIWDDYLYFPTSYHRDSVLLKLVRTESGFEVQEKYRRRMWLDPFQDNTVLVDDHIFTFLFPSQPIGIAIRTGETVWQQEKQPQRGRVGVTYADGRLYARYSNGLMTLVDVTPGGFVEKGSFTILDHVRSYGSTNPVIADGRLLLRDNARLFCYDIRQDALKAPRPAPKSVAIRISASKPENDPRPGGGRSVFVPTPHDVVEKMLELAAIQESDLVYDLGSGDGRIVIAAAKKYGCRAIGIEIDRELVELSGDKAKQAGVAKLVTFECQDVFTADLSEAEVVAMYLLPQQLKQLIPQLEKLKPGARIVSHQFEIPGVAAEKKLVIQSKEDGEEHPLYLWTAPLRNKQCKIKERGCPSLFVQDVGLAAQLPLEHRAFGY
jgi:outer membrane protein assembly factor BamB